MKARRINEYHRDARVSNISCRFSWSEWLIACRWTSVATEALKKAPAH